MAFANDDTQAVRGNLKRARRCQTRNFCVLRSENTSAKVNGMLYKAAVQSVLLFESETWSLVSETLQWLEGFHVKITRQMTRMLPKKTGETWR